MLSEDNTVFFSRFAFIFLIYAVITSGYINETLSCQMRRLLTTNHEVRHLFGVIMVCVFIMLEGGWSFDKKTDDEASNSWSSGNVLHTFVMGLAIYTIFLISSKSRLVPNMIFFGLVLLLYVINTQRSYWVARKKLDETSNRRLIGAEVALFALAMAVLAYGFIDYILYQKGMYGSRFSWHLFLLGTGKCRSFE